MLALLALGAFVHVAAADALDDPFISLFGTTCFSQYTNLGGLSSNLQRDNFSELTGMAAKPFLGNGIGRVWTSSFQSYLYAIAVRDDGVCAVFAQRVLPERAKERFKATFSSGPSPMKSQEIQVLSPNSTTQTISYAWFSPGSDNQIQFTLTIVNDAAADIQAMVSMARVRRVP